MEVGTACFWCLIRGLFGQVLLTGCEDMTVIVHDTTQPSGSVATLTGHDSWVLSVAHR